MPKGITSWHIYRIEMFQHPGAPPKVMSLELLKKITNNFSKEQEIGRGTFGIVYKGVEGGEEVAVKLLRTQGHDDRELFVREFENLWRLRHQNIVQLLGYCYETKGEYIDSGNGRFVFADKIYIALCFEYMHNGSLRAHLYDEYNGHDWQTRYKIIKGIWEGLKYLHEGLESPMYHLDLKPENILLDKTMVPKIADFGLSKLVDSDQTKATQSLVGTRGYMPPEYIEVNLVSNKFDIFSLGVVMIRIITGYEGYYNKDEMSSQEFIDLVHRNWRKRLQATSGCTSLEAECHQVRRCIQIALDCVHTRREERPKIGDIINWLRETEQMIENTKFKDRPIKDNFTATSNVTSPSMGNPKRGPANPRSQGTEYNLNLYMHQVIHGPNRNQVNIADPKQPLMFGYTNVHDYPIYDSLGPGPRIIARAQGLHTEIDMNKDDWFHWSSIVFSDERFQGSSFKAIGNQNKVEGEWAIVGGTGVFTFAQGTISIRRIQDNGPSNIKEIRISAFCGTPQATTSYTKTIKDGVIMVDSNAIRNVGCPFMTNVQNGPVSPQDPEYNLNMYMDQTIDGPNHKQVNIADPKQPQMFGCTNVHDYPIYDSLGPSAKIIARAQGLHTKTSMNNDDWFYWSSIVFSDERFLGSSFKAIGNQNEVEGEWAIVGGTGVFTLAQGTIFIRGIQYNGSSSVKEIRIRAFCHKPETNPTVTETCKNGVIKIDFNASSSVGSPSMAHAQSDPVVTPQFQGTEYNRTLYMQQSVHGPHHNQVNIADPKQPWMFGFTNVHDYPIYDSLDNGARIVARAQGLHTETSMNNDDWFHWSSIVFYDERFRSSSFKAIGNQNKVEGEWAIVGGTGAFTCAQGTVSICRIQGDGSSNIKEIRISAILLHPIH